MMMMMIVLFMFSFGFEFGVGGLEGNLEHPIPGTTPFVSGRALLLSAWRAQEFHARVRHSSARGRCWSRSNHQSVPVEVRGTARNRSEILKHEITINIENVKRMKTEVSCEGVVRP